MTRYAYICDGEVVAWHATLGDAGAAGHLPEHDGERVGCALIDTTQPMTADDARAVAERGAR
jgi:hypothetical protein